MTGKGETLILTFAVILGFTMAFSIGANDVANSMATAVGAKAITPRQAAFIAMFLEFLGAVMFGAHVSKTIVKGIVKPDFIDKPEYFLFGALSALLASTVWILVATHWSMPISTTHSIVGGMMGFGIVAFGFESINWITFFHIAVSWVLSPLFGGLLAYVTFKTISGLILHADNPWRAARRYAPFLIAVAIFVMFFLFFKKTLKISLTDSSFYSFLLSIAGFIIAFLSIERLKGADEYESVENVFKRAQIFTSCYVSFSHGANDVANAAGPIAAVFIILKTSVIPEKVDIPLFILMLGGIGISMGVFFMGYRVMRTVGENITHLTNTRGFAVDFSTATTVLLASVLGMPISTTHVVVGSVTGVGIARGVETVNVGVLKNIILSWLITVPFTAGSSALLFLMFKNILNLS